MSHTAIFRNQSRPAAWFFGGCVVCAGVILTGWLRAAQVAAPAKPATPEPVIEKPIPKSEFISRTNQPGFGRDPFFPGTLRFNPPKPKDPVPVVPATGTGNPVIVPPPPPPTVVLTLSGIMGSRVAIINSRSYLKGEGGLIPDAKARIRVDEIKAKSVNVTVFMEDGKTETRELFLKEQ